MTQNNDDAALKAERALAEEVTKDFLRRQEDRRFLERGWQLNMNFMCGNQYCDVNARGEIEEEPKSYFWQNRRVFNYIAPTVETRCAKLARIRPAMKVRAASEEEGDRHSADLASAILSSVQESENLDGLVSRATVWSETCGTVFYQVIWDNAAGLAVGIDEAGNKVKDGGVKIAVVPPFEIYPDSLSEERMENQRSIIHAKAVSVEDIYAAYGVRLAGRDIEEFSLAPYSAAAHSRRCRGSVKAVLRGHELVIERYQRPTENAPCGRLTVVAGGELLYDGEMPYINGEDGERTYPFVKQTSLPLAGSFFGSSVVDRLIPVQRSYNAVKNRKHEFLNRISMGTIAVEDGSVDVDELSEDGLQPGKILVYRQGGTPPEMLSLGSVPDCFLQEEERLESEFNKISGTGEFTQNADNFSSVTSATGLQLIIEQDDARLNMSYQEIKDALKGIGKQIIRLYRQFAGDMRLMRFSGGGNSLKVFYFKGSDISSDDVVFEADSDVNMTAAQKRTVIYEMIEKGLFSDETGRISSAAKGRILDALGYSDFADGRDLSALYRNSAGRENIAMKSGAAEVKDYDDHVLHINEHTAFLLSDGIDSRTERRVCEHIETHRKKQRENFKEEINGQPDEI